MIGIISGSGFYEMPGYAREQVTTRFGDTVAWSGKNEQGVETLLLPRHGAGHSHLPHQINHRAHLLALKKLGAQAVISLSVCGVINPDLPLAVPLLATDVLFPDNRLGDGTACTIFDTPGETGRGHLLAESLVHDGLSESVRTCLEATAQIPHQGCYAHVPGPRFNTKAEIAALRAAGADFLSQTCGPEAVLANELELPYAMVGFGVDYANGVQADPTQVETLQANLERGKHCFEDLINRLAPPPDGWRFANFVYRFES